MPRVLLVIASFFFLSTYFSVLLLIMNISSLAALAAAPWCKTHKHVVVVTSISAFAFMHCNMAMLLMEGPLHWGLLGAPLVMNLPALASLSVSKRGKRLRLIVIVYTVVLINAVLILRHFGFVVTSSLINHGFSETFRFVVNLLSLNILILAAGQFSRDIAAGDQVRDQDQLFASISHDMRQPCHAMSLLIPFIMEAMAASQVEGVTSAEKHRLQDSQKADMRQLNGLVGTLLTLVEDFLFFSKLRQNSGNVPPVPPAKFVCRDLVEEVF
jgi:signal transduction histidine kinase